MSALLDLTESASDDEESHFSAPTPVKSEGGPSEPRPPVPAYSGVPPRPRFNNEPDAPRLTIVNGRGFWKSWTRSFKSTLLKLLDLVDNAVDGAGAMGRGSAHRHALLGRGSDPGFVGRVHVYPDVYVQSGAAGKKKHRSTTGLCIRNNSPKPLVPLSEALVVHQTTKADAAEIGENGVGLKQACAALCDLSFVLARNRSDEDVELGIVAKSLQREEGPYLPAFQFSNKKGGGKATLREQMLSLFSQPHHHDVSQCVAQYGADVTGDDPSLASGIDALCNRFDDMCDNFFENDYVFEVILNGIRHDQCEDEDNKRAMYLQQKITVTQLVKDLQREIPMHYLHIPDSLEFLVGKQRLDFKYWQERLVELSTFTVTVGKTIPWMQNFETSDQHPDSYDLQLFLGFDRFRIAESDVKADTGEKTSNKTASLHYYSRQSGRLIKSELDARHTLGLTTGSSYYASALTIIIDDIGGNLPLHPTKQDVAFGNKNKGGVHEENLCAWVGAVTKFYYNFYLKSFSNKKKVLNAKISRYVDSKLPKKSKSFEESDFTSFELAFENKRNMIYVDNKLTKKIDGSDTHFILLPDEDAGNDISNGSGKKRSRSTAPQNKAASKNNYEERRKQAKSQPSPYHEESDPDSGGAVDGDTCGQLHHASNEAMHEDRNLKVEEVLNNGCNDDFGCIDLCESSDEEDNAPRNRLQHARTTTKFSDATRPVPIKTNKVVELEQTIENLREESKSKISSLEDEVGLLKDENKSLKEQLKRKEKMVQVLRLRLEKTGAST
ncbi:hypothetical protein ACHAWF_008043 [Thalassiosira exigua]